MIGHTLAGYLMFGGYCATVLSGLAVFVRHENRGPVCGACSDDMGDTFDTWADAVRDGLDTVPCRVCGQTASAGV
ncbi:MAG: hypothetical protein EBV53_08870 [Proteobacteria bacterium]|nr:hypothetical protein [Pseudomonadota bacterium]